MLAFILFKVYAILTAAGELAGIPGMTVVVVTLSSDENARRQRGIVASYSPLDASQAATMLIW